MKIHLEVSGGGKEGCANRPTLIPVNMWPVNNRLYLKIVDLFIVRKWVNRKRFLNSISLLEAIWGVKLPIIWDPAKIPIIWDPAKILIKNVNKWRHYIKHLVVEDSWNTILWQQEPALLKASEQTGAPEAGAAGHGADVAVLLKIFELGIVA